MTRALSTAMFFAAACLSAPAVAQDVVYDPWEGANRNLFAAHEAIDQAVLEPVARGYRTVTNEPVRSGVTNFLRNLRAPVVFVNDVLQGKPGRAGVTAARFGVNSTIGLFGVLDPAETMGLTRHDEDFGQTLAVWGVPAGPYVFVPALGPTNVRDGAGRVIDIAFSPLTWAEFEGEDAFTATRITASAVSGREGVLDLVDDVRATSLDPYVTYRTTYGLLRDSAIRDGARSPEPQEFNEGLTQNDPGAASDWAMETDWGAETDWSQGWEAQGVTEVTEPAGEARQELLIGGVP